MALIFKTDKRRIIPRWRSLDTASLTGELNVVSNQESIQKFNTKEYLNEQRSAWQKNKNLSYAGDLLGSAFVLGLESEFTEVARFILDNEQDAYSSSIRVANKVLKIAKQQEGATILNVDINNPNRYIFDIKKYKSYTNKEPRNPIAWIELGRLYSLLGQVKKAQKCIDTALYLDKNNRFIVRSASRYYHHFHGDKDIALQIIKKSTFVNQDPWLISAEIAYSSILERFSRMTKIGKEILNHQTDNYFSTTELASAVGTVEFSNGKLKDARKYFKQSLIKPNDNSLAQAEWMSNSITGINIENSKFDLPFAFEAKSLSEYHKENFQLSYNYAIDWLKDEPYSIRPILTASYVAGIFLNNRDASIKLLKEGLEMNNNDSMLINDLVYFLAIDGKIEEALQLFKNKMQQSLRDPKNIDSITMTATFGLLMYKTNEPEEGKKYYLKSIEMAKKEKNDYLVAVAMAHYVKEEVRFSKNPEESKTLISELNKICKDRTEPDVKKFLAEALAEYEVKM